VIKSSIVEMLQVDSLQVAPWMKLFRLFGSSGIWSITLLFRACRACCIVAESLSVSGNPAWVIRVQ